MSFLLLQSGTLCCLERHCLIGQRPPAQQPTASSESCKVVKPLSEGQEGEQCVSVWVWKISITYVSLAKRARERWDRQISAL